MGAAALKAGHSNTIFTVRDVIDESGDVIQSYEFSEHGLPMPGSGASSGTFAPKTYQGALSVNDDRNDSGLYLMGHRHYASDLGRFISRDPIGFNGRLNLFIGHSTSPMTFVDPSGMKPKGGFARVVEVMENVRVHILDETRLTYEQAVEAVRSGQDILCSSEGFAFNVAQDAGGARPYKEQHRIRRGNSDGSMRMSHYHPTQIVDGIREGLRPFGRSVHVFFSFLGPVGDILDIPQHLEETATLCKGERVRVPAIYVEGRGGLHFTPLTGFTEFRPEWSRDYHNRLDEWI